MRLIIEARLEGLQTDPAATAIMIDFSGFAIVASRAEIASQDP